MPSRRSVLKGFGVALVGAPIGAAAMAAQTAGPGASAAARGLPLTIVNHTYRYTNSQIWVYIVGTELATGRQAYARPDGTLVPVSGSDNGDSIGMPLAADGDTTLAIPPGMSGRVYVSLVDKLPFTVVTDGNGNPALQYPAGWVRSDPSYSVLHDCVEFTHNDAGMFCNTTMVDMFSVPLAIRLTGAADQTTGTLTSGGRDRIFSALRATPDFAPLVIGDRRVIAPGHGIDTGIFPADYYDSYIDRVWERYTSAPLTVDVGTAVRTGRVSGGTLRFDGGVSPFGKPSTLDVFYCHGALGAPNDGVTGPVAAVLGAAFNRSTLLTSARQPTTDRSGFYTDAVTNHYAKVLHESTADGKAYGFPFDDVAGFAPYVEDRAPTSLTVRLTPF